MKFKAFSQYLQRLEKTPSRNEITQILAELFKESSQKEIDKIVYLASGQLAPSYVGIDFNIAEKLMMRIIAKAYGVDLEKVKAEFKQKGDLGIVGEGLAKAKGKDPEVLEVYETLLGMAREAGGGRKENRPNGGSSVLFGSAFRSLRCQNSCRKLTPRLFRHDHS